MNGQMLLCFIFAVLCGVIAQRSRNNILAIYICFGFALQYSFSLASVLASGNFEGNFGVAGSWVLAATVLVFLFGSVQIVSSSILLSKLPAVSKKKDGSAVFLLFSFSVIGLILLLVTGGLSMGDRLQARAGYGFLFIFGYAGLALCLALASGFLGCYRAVSMALLCLPTCIFFIIAGYRSIALIVLICPFFPIIKSQCERRRYLVPLIFGLSVLSANYVNLITGSVRSLLSQGKSLTPVSVAERYEALRSAQPIPLATSHLEMLGGYLEHAGLADLLLGTFRTATSSFLNFLPRAVFPDKGDTSGVYFASIYFPEWFAYGYHNSSLTTGIFLDFVFNFGIPLSLLVLAVIYISMGFVVSKLFRGSGYESVLGIYLCWLFGFNVFFDDLGGIINKLVIGFIFYAGARLLGALVRASRGGG